MAVTGARLNFFYFAVGAEGCAHDSQVLAKINLTDTFPTDCYILFDAGGPLIKFKILTPYKGG